MQHTWTCHGRVACPCAHARTRITTHAVPLAAAAVTAGESPTSLTECDPARSGRGACQGRGTPGWATRCRCPRRQTRPRQREAASRNSSLRRGRATANGRGRWELEVWHRILRRPERRRDRSQRSHGGAGRGGRGGAERRGGARLGPLSRPSPLRHAGCVGAAPPAAAARHHAPPPAVTARTTAAT